MGFGLKIGSQFRLAIALTWCVLVVSTVSAARFEIRNEIDRYPGRNRSLSFNCWSKNNQLGMHSLRPGESKSWSFKPIFIKVPFFYTYFECTFFTAFGSPYGQTAPVYAGERLFRWECDNPEEEECIWAVKREGLYLRKIKRDSKGQRLYDDALKMAWIGGTNYHPVKEEP